MQKPELRGLEDARYHVTVPGSHAYASAAARGACLLLLTPLAAATPLVPVLLIIDAPLTLMTLCSRVPTKPFVL